MFGRELDYEEAVLSLPDTSPKVSLFSPAFVLEVSPFSLPLVTRESWSLRGYPPSSFCPSKFVSSLGFEDSKVAGVNGKRESFLKGKADRALLFEHELFS